jgi:hypothetical protein
MYMSLQVTSNKNGIKLRIKAHSCLLTEEYDLVIYSLLGESIRFFFREFIRSFGLVLLVITNSLISLSREHQL